MTYHSVARSPLITSGLPESRVPASLHVSGQILDRLIKLPAAKRAKALEPLIAAARSLEAIAQKAPLSMPPLLYVYGNTDGPHMAWGDWLTQRNEHQEHERVPVVGMNIHLLCDGSTLTNDPPWRPILRLTPEESYAVMAHEVGHLFHGHVKVPEMRYPTQNIPGRAHNHTTEHEADGTAIRLGADADAMIRAMLKIQRWNREHIYKQAQQTCTTFPANETIARNDYWQNAMALRSIVTANNMRGGHSHPSIHDRHSHIKATQHERNWQDRLAAALENTEELVRGK